MAFSRLEFLSWPKPYSTPPIHVYCHSFGASLFRRRLGHRGLIARSLAACALIVVILPASGQSASPQVLLPLIAVDYHGHAVADLTPESLILSDNKNPISSGAKLIRGAGLPLRLGILIDTSNSQRDASLYEAGVSGVKDFVNQIMRLEDDRVFFQLFSTTTQATPLLTRGQLAGVSFSVQVGGYTVLYDAIALACIERMGKADWQNPVRRVIVILSDGNDSHSHINLSKAVAFAEASGVLIFSISTNATGTRSKGNRVLEKISNTTGGTAYTDVYSEDVPKIFRKIREQVDSMYYVTYVPPGPLAKDDVHTVQVKAAKGNKLELHAPERYAWNP